MVKLKIREYKPTDFHGLLEISKHIWEGHDYLPKKINDFYIDPHSSPMVVIEEGKIVSIANLRFLNREIAWLEAIRTHPEFRGKGYATSLTKAMIKKARAEGATEVWLMTNTENKATAILLEKLGFSESGRVAMWPNWDIMTESLKKNSIQNKHFDKLATSQTKKEARASEDGNSYRTLIESFPVTNKTLELSKKWKKITQKSHMKEILSKIVKLGGMNIIYGEFHIYPQDMFDLDKKIQNKEILYLEEPPALLLFEKSEEIELGYGIGLNTCSSYALESALYFLLENYPKLIYWLFFPESLQHLYIKPGFHLQRFMCKKLNS
ncbi:MAG: GNAT family N-acetyltransferase [Candidatus Heimdallarchaeota archaeon]|nr:GNAT family N-acetyltransferase [Candidatus Heimdallarchaeota archaeon]